MFKTSLRSRLPMASCNTTTLLQRRSLSTHGSSSRYISVDNKLTLADGRVLGYNEYGCPSGFPIVLFHGYPSSRLEASVLNHLARKHSLRIVAPDRPGYGISSYQKDRKITDWPADVARLTHHLGLSQFSVLGLSGGGPYALACAAMLPSKSLYSVGLMASAPLWGAGAHHVSYARRILAYLAQSWPRTLGIVSSCALRAMQWLVKTNRARRAIESWIQKLDEIREKGQGPELIDPTNKRPLSERRDSFIRILLEEPFAQGMDGVVLETRLLAKSDWGFCLGDVDHERVMIWHGTKDANAPIQMIRRMAEQIPGCTLQEWPEDTHYTVGDKIEQVLLELTSVASATSVSR